LIFYTAFNSGLTSLLSGIPELDWESRKKQNKPLFLHQPFRLMYDLLFLPKKKKAKSPGTLPTTRQLL
jgi:hypothetical protein